MLVRHDERVADQFLHGHSEPGEKRDGEDGREENLHADHILKDQDGMRKGAEHVRNLTDQIGIVPQQQPDQRDDQAQQEGLTEVFPVGAEIIPDHVGLVFPPFLAQRIVERRRRGTPEKESQKDQPVSDHGTDGAETGLPDQKSEQGQDGRAGGEQPQAVQHKQVEQPGAERVNDSAVIKDLGDASSFLCHGSSSQRRSSRRKRSSPQA